MICKTFRGHSISPEIALVYNNDVIAVVKDGEIFEHRKEERIARQFGIVDPRHPTIKQILESGNWLLGGDVQVAFCGASIDSVCLYHVFSIVLYFSSLIMKH